MRLFNKTIDRQLFKQYSLGSDLSKQEVVAKIFNPMGAGTWFILNSDPQDPDYLWAIVDLGYGAEVGSVSRSELENYRGRFGLGFERDLSFDPINAEELYQGLRQGEYYSHGGETEERIKQELASLDPRIKLLSELSPKEEGYEGIKELVEKRNALQAKLLNLKGGFADGGQIEVVYERRADFKKKPIKLLLLSRGKEQKGYTFSGKDQVAVLDNYNRNKQEDLEKLWNLKGYETKYANGGEVSSRLSNNFLIVKIKGKTYKTWFPNWLSINKNFLEKLNKENKSVLIVEEENGNSKQFEVPNRDLMDIWLNDKSDKKTRDVLIQKAIEYNNNSFADGGSIDNYDVVIDGDWDEPKKFRTFSLAKKWIYQNAKNYESLELVDPYGDTIFVEGNSTKEDLDWLFSNDEVSAFAKGGNIANFSDNQLMIMNQNVEVEHHHEELEDILEDKVPVPAWVVAKMETATQNLSDITHYLDGEKEIMEDQLEEEDDDDDEDEMETEEIENKEVVEPIVVTAGDKTEITKNFTDDAWDNLRGFLKGMEGIDLRDDYTFDYKDEQYEVEPIINSDENGVSNAVFTIFDGDGEEVGEVAYSREGGKQKFTANSEFFSWNNAKFEDGGYFDGTIPNVSTYMSTYAKGGMIDYSKEGYVKAIRNVDGKMIKEVTIDNQLYRFNPVYKTYNSVKNNEILHKSKYEDGGFMNNVYADGGSIDIEKTLKAKDKFKFLNNNDIFTIIKVYGSSGDLLVHDQDGYQNVFNPKELKGKINKVYDYANGGGLEKVKWQEVEIGDSARVKELNRLGLIIHTYGRKFHLKFPNGTEKTFDASELEFFKLEKDEYEMDDNNNFAKGGMVVTSVKDIPNFKERLEQRRITYRGLGMGKVADDFYKLAGTSGTRIKVDGKEYFITDEEFNTFSRDADGKMQIRFDAPARKGYADGGFMNGVYEDGGFLDKYEVDRFKQVMNGKAIAKYIVRLQDSFGNKETYVFGIKIKDQFKGCELVPYESLYGGWSNSGTAFSLDNLQVKRLVPNSFSEIELDEQETEMLVNKLIKNNQAGVEKYLNSAFFYLSYNQSFKDVLRGHLARSVVKIVSVEFEIAQKFADGGKIKLGDIVEVKEPNYGFDSDYYVVENKAGYDKKGFLLSETRKREGSVFDKDQLNKLYAKGGSVKKDWWQTVVNPNEDFHNYDNRKPIDWEVDDFKEWVVSNSDLDGNVDKEVLDVVKMPKSKLTVEYLNKNGSGKNNNEYYKEFGNWQSALYDIFTQLKKDYLFKKSSKYILKADIKTVTVKRKDKEVTYNGSDVLNGAYVLAKGGDMTSKANYVGKNDVVEVELKDGSKVKPVNGYWIKKGAEPVGAEPTPTTSGKSETKFGETYIKKDMRNNWKAETTLDDFNDYDWKISTIKTYSGNLVSSAQGGKTEPTGSKGIQMWKYTMYQDPNHTLEVSKPKRLTDKVVTEQHEKALAKFKKFMETGTFARGGKISNFDKLSAKVAKEYEGKPVKSQYQEEYGKYYSKEEAQEVGDKVAGKMKAMTADKKENGGRISMKLANELAKEIRKDGESWNDAKKRAFAQLKK